jgi:hypothetical protein
MENNNNDEKWVECWDFPTYEISNLGNIRNAKTGKQLKVRQDGREYRMVCLWYNGKGHTKRIGRLVWMSFNKQYCSATIDHINIDAGDDRLENLRCVPMEVNRENRKDYSKKNKYNLTKNDKAYIHYSIKNGYETTWTIMKQYGIPLNYISNTIKRGTWSKYLDLIDDQAITKMKQRKLLYDLKRL